MSVTSTPKIDQTLYGVQAQQSHDGIAALEKQPATVDDLQWFDSMDHHNHRISASLPAGTFHP